MATIDVKGIETIEDLTKYHTDNIVEDGNGTVASVIMYGRMRSYNPQLRISDMSQEEFDSNVKPDFLVVAKTLGQFYSEWEDGERLLALNQESPNYYNRERDGLKYKIGVVDVRLMEKMTSNDKENIYLSGRLHKGGDVVFCTPEADKFIDSCMGNARSEGIRLALRRLPEFEYNKLIGTIAMTSYMAESWRFEWGRAEEIVDGPVGAKLREEYLPYLITAASQRKIEMNNGYAPQDIELSNVDEMRFTNAVYSRLDHLKALWEVARYNVPSLMIALKQRKTNKGSAWSYFMRKVRKNSKRFLNRG